MSKLILTLNTLLKSILRNLRCILSDKPEEELAGFTGIWLSVCV